MSSFKHPLARDAKIWRTGGLAGEQQPILVIITSLELDPQHARHNPRNVERLTEAAREWIGANAGSATDILLMNRPKKWAGDKD